MFKDKIRKIDIEAIIKFFLAYPISRVVKHKHPRMWLISERPGEARDNGYALYNYIRDKHPGDDVFYVISRDGIDRKKFENSKKIIDFYSFRHYIYYLAAYGHASAHVDAGTPNNRVSNYLETHGLLKNKKVFLQHGVTKDKISFGYYSVSRADLFVCAAKPEYDFCKKEFGYPDGAVQLLGFARFDGLELNKSKRQILLMPTWRAWLANADEEEFIHSEYYQTYQGLINNLDLNEFLATNNMKLIFFPHSDMQKFLHLYKTSCSQIEIAGSAKNDVQTLLVESALLITDYSSVAFDMAYMERPVIYFHFDYEEYRGGQHPEGYYSYTNDGFGPVCKDKVEVISYIKRMVNNSMRMEQKYTERVNDFFAYRDQNNCSRIYEAIKEL